MSDAWQEQHAYVLELEAARLRRIIAELEDAHAIVETRAGSEDLCTAIRSLIGWLRSEATTMEREARELRLALQDTPAGLPAQITPESRMTTGLIIALLIIAALLLLFPGSRRR